MRNWLLLVLVQGGFFMEALTAPTIDGKEPSVYASTTPAVEENLKDYHSPTLDVNEDDPVNPSPIAPVQKESTDYQSHILDVKKDIHVHPSASIEEKDLTDNTSPTLAIKKFFPASTTTTVKKTLPDYHPSIYDVEKDLPFFLFPINGEENFPVYQPSKLSGMKDFPVSPFQTSEKEEISDYHPLPLAVMRDLPFYMSQPEEEDIPVYQPSTLDAIKDLPTSPSTTSVKEHSPFYFYQPPVYPEFYTTGTGIEGRVVTPVLPLEGIFDDFEQDVEMSKKEEILSLIDKLQEKLDELLKDLKN